MKTTREELLEQIEAYMARHEMSARDFGVALKNDTAFVYRLRRGRGLSDKTVDRVRRFIQPAPLERRRRKKAEHRSAA